MAARDDTSDLGLSQGVGAPIYHARPPKGPRRPFQEPVRMRPLAVYAAFAALFALNWTDI